MFMEEEKSDGETNNSGSGDYRFSHDKDEEEIAEMRDAFGIPETEKLYSYYNCVNNKNYSGKLYIFTHFLCFNSMLRQQSQRELVPLLDVVELKKLPRSSKGLYLDNAIGIDTSSRKSFKYYRFVRREFAFNLIMKRLTEIGLKITEKVERRVAFKFEEPKFEDIEGLLIAVKEIQREEEEMSFKDDVMSWDIGEVQDWVSRILEGTTEYADMLKEHQIGGASLVLLQKEDLIFMGMKKMGHIVLLNGAISDLRSCMP